MNKRLGGGGPSNKSNIDGWINLSYRQMNIVSKKLSRLLIEYQEKLKKKILLHDR